jgi:hypothetical protein
MASGRVRTAELAGSMLWAAPLVALLTIPAAALLSIDVTSDPQQLAFLYGMTLFGTWATLIPNKLIEFSKLDWINRRLIALAGGLLVGGVGLVLAQTLRLDLTPQQAFLENASNLNPVYFGTLYAIMGGWSSLTARDRRARFSIMPVLATALLATALMPLWPYIRQDGIAIAVLIALSVQLVSPWNEAAALYSRYVRVTDKQRRKGQVA